jgi:hypothetical protein
LQRRIKNDTITLAIGVLGPRAAAQAAETLSLKTSKFSRKSATIKSALAINQRVIRQSGRLKKLNAIRGQKNAKRGFDRLVDKPVEWQFTLCLQ